MLCCQMSELCKRCRMGDRQEASCQPWECQSISDAVSKPILRLVVLKDGPALFRRGVIREQFGKERWRQLFRKISARKERLVDCHELLRVVLSALTPPVTYRAIQFSFPC